MLLQQMLEWILLKIFLIPSLLGYNWCGPFLSAGVSSINMDPELMSYYSPLESFSPMNSIDEACLFHDFLYSMGRKVDADDWHLIEANSGSIYDDVKKFAYMKDYHSVPLNSDRKDIIREALAYSADNHIINQCASIDHETRSDYAVCSVMTYTFKLKTWIMYNYDIPAFFTTLHRKDFEVDTMVGHTKFNYSNDYHKGNMKVLIDIIDLLKSQD
jgi:hypothetical protein